MTSAVSWVARLAAVVVGVSLVGWAIYGCGRPRDRHAVTPTETLVLPEGGAAQSVLVSAAREPVGGVVLLQHAGGEVGDWQPLATRLAASAMTSLAILPPSTSLVSRALEAGVARLVEENVAPEKVALVASRDDCDGALAFAARHREVTALVLISPESREETGRLGAWLADYGKRPILLVTAEGDAFGNATALSIKESAQGIAELRQYPGMSRGTDLLALSESAVEQIAYWLEAVVTERTPLQSSETAP